MSNTDINANAARLRKQTANGKEARAHIRVRIALCLFAALSLAGAAIAGINITSISTYNEATQKLEANMAESKKPDVDLHRLLVQQQQTNAQFEDARQFNALLLPPTRQRINTNLQLSQSMTITTRHKLAASQDKSANGKPNKTSNAQHNANGKDQGLSEEQRQEVERMLKANQSANGQNNKPNNSSPKPSNTPAKPW